MAKAVVAAAVREIVSTNLGAGECWGVISQPAYSPLVLTEIL